MLNTVKVPEQFETIFEKAQEYVNRYFIEKKEDPSKGTIELFGERYILVRAASMSVDFFETIEKLYEKEGEEEAVNIARQFLFDIAHAIGRQDAGNFHKRMGLKDPIEKLSAGPVHFSHTGWAFVDIFPESMPVPDENYYLIYDHPYAFESAAWLASGKKSNFPVCVMNAGYSSGWCEESFGFPLVASEILCIAKGDPACRFIMATPSRIEGFISGYKKSKPELAAKITKYEVPGFFKRKEMEAVIRRQEAEWRNTFDSISDFVSIHDKDFRFVKVNKTMADFLGLKPEELVNKHCYEFVHGLTEPWSTCPHAEALKSKRGETREVNDPRLGRSLLVSCSPIFNEKGEMTGSVHIAKDITERKKAEEERERLLKETGRINKELNDFAYIVSHDLKAPLRAISQLAGWLSEDYSGVLDDTGKEMLKVLRSRTIRMHNMIEGILQYSRIGRIKGEPEVINIEKIVRLVTDSLLLPENIHLTVHDDLPQVTFDPLHISQIFQNLLSNAIKYMDKPEGLIEIGCRDVDNFHEFFVKDNGPGIEEKYFERIFQIFQTLKSKDEFESTGIGLSIVKKIIEQNGGSIWVESEIGKGSTFKFTITKTPGH